MNPYEEWLDILNEVSAQLEEFVMDEQSQRLLKKLDKVIDGVYELSQNFITKDGNNVEPDYVTTSYTTNGHTKEYYGQNGASVVTDCTPLPEGYVITIKEPENKGGDNE